MSEVMSEVMSDVKSEVMNEVMSAVMSEVMSEAKSEVKNEAMSAVKNAVVADRRGRPVIHPREQRLPSTVAVDTRARDTVYLPTLFDRLCDDMPSERSEAPDIYSYKRNQLRAIVQRDLAFLLNTTRDDPAQAPSHAASSTLHYGVAPLAGGYLSETKWAQVEHVIRQAILDFEPRLDPQTLQVRPLSKEHDSANYNVLTFEIAGHILMQPYPIEFLVQSAVDLENSRIELHDARP